MANIPFYRCAKCKLYLPQTKTCQIMIPQMQGKIEPEDHCSKCMPIISICEVCGGGTLTPFIEIEGETVHTYCQNCLMQKHAQNP